MLLCPTANFCITHWFQFHVVWAHVRRLLSSSNPISLALTYRTKDRTKNRSINQFVLVFTKNNDININNTSVTLMIELFTSHTIAPIYALVCKHRFLYRNWGLIQKFPPEYACVMHANHRYDLTRTFKRRKPDLPTSIYKQLLWSLPFFVCASLGECWVHGKCHLPQPSWITIYWVTFWWLSASCPIIYKNPAGNFLNKTNIYFGCTFSAFVNLFWFFLDTMKKIVTS